MSNEIKQGDKVRVSEGIPQFYRKYNSMRMFEQTFRVVDIEDGLALLKSTSILMYTIVLPTKYLVKVDAEAKVPKFKVNDVVRTVFNETTHITSVLENGNYYLYGMGNEYPEDSLTLIRSYTEPTQGWRPSKVQKHL